MDTFWSNVLINQNIHKTAFLYICNHWHMGRTSYISSHRIERMSLKNCAESKPPFVWTSKRFSSTKNWASVTLTANQWVGWKGKVLNPTQPPDYWYHRVSTEPQRTIQMVQFSEAAACRTNSLRISLIDEYVYTFAQDLYYHQLCPLYFLPRYNLYKCTFGAVLNIKVIWLNLFINRLFVFDPFVRVLCGQLF